MKKEICELRNGQMYYTTHNISTIIELELVRWRLKNWWYHLSTSYED